MIYCLILLFRGDGQKTFYFLLHPKERIAAMSYLLNKYIKVFKIWSKFESSLDWNIYLNANMIK